jgi:CheY-like chemotaxis protein
LEHSPFNLPQLLEETVKLVELNAKDKGLELLIDIAPTLKRNFVGDSFRLHQILTNLIANAIKFTDSGFIKIQVSLGQSIEQLCFCIEDSGIGMTATQLENIFAAFQQADTSTSRRFGGTGLGTTIAKQLVNLMGGQIWVESEAGKGSQFYFNVNLNLTSIEEDALLANQQANPQLSQAFTCKRRFTVLLAEDIEENIILAQTRLEEQQHKVTVVKNGREAVAAFQLQHFDLILMDVNMPDMDGMEATRQIRELEKNRSEKIAIIAMTASIMADERKKYAQMGIDATVGKPIDFYELFATMEQVVADGVGVAIETLPTASPAPVNRELPTLKGIDVATALQRWRTMSAYQRGLTLFLDNYSDLAAQLLPWLAEQRFEKITELNHTLKGVSGSLAMPAMFRLTELIEFALREQRAEELNILLPDLIAAVECLKPEIKLLLAHTESQ